MAAPTKTTGIFQGDLAVRGFFVEALRQVRAQPWLLDFCFAGVPQDALTAEEYGDFDVAQAKKWFLATKIPVFVMPRKGDPPDFPAVTVRHLSGQEAEVTLADVNYDPNEFNDDQPALSAKFDPESYDPSTGRMTVPDAVGAGLVIAPGQLVVDHAGAQHPILDVDGDASFFLDKNLSADFRGAWIVGAKPGTVTALESVSWKETYAIGCHVQGEPVHLLYLGTIVLFCALAFKQALLEGRGFERSSIARGEPALNTTIDKEDVYSWPMTLSGYARQFWPKSVSLTVSSSTGTIVIDGAGDTSGSQDPALALWVGDGDPEADGLDGVG